MRIIALVGLAVLLVVLQGTWLEGLGLPLNLPLLLTLATAWWGGRTLATAVGFWTGALLGAMTGTSVPFSLLYALMGWSAATLLSTHPRRGVLRATLLGASSALSIQGLESLIWVVAQHPPRLEPGQVLAQLLWNGLAMGLLAWLAGRSRPWRTDWKPLVYGG